MRWCETGPYLSLFRVCSFPGVAASAVKGETLLQQASVSALRDKLALG